jgi:hypothetical protein
MTTTIPYDSSLVLGNIVQKEKIDILEQISVLQAPIESAQENLNSKILLQRSLEMTIQDLLNMKINPSDLQKNLNDVKNQILEAAKNYAKVRIDNESKIFPLKSKISLVHDSIESPIDYNRTAIKKMPLSADSLKLDAQYFSFDEMKQDASNVMASIKGYIAEATSFLGQEQSTTISGAAQTQLAKQFEHHDLEGTLIITAGTTQKDAVLLAPFILDVDKGIRAWNSYFPDKLIKMDDLENILKIAQEEGTKDEAKLQLISGATYGSSFVGMVHILKQDKTSASQSMNSVSASIQEQAKAGTWFSGISGGFGLNTSFSNDIKHMLSSQNISSHVSLITMGSIPNIKSNPVALAVKQFSNFDPESMMNKLALLQNATAGDQDTVNTQIKSALTGQQLEEMESTKIKAVMSGLIPLQDGENKMLDINSLMTAFEDYVAKALDGNVGVPINYYLKPITRAQLAQMWVAKYYPGKYLAISGDDSGNTKTGGNTQTS